MSEDKSEDEKPKKFDGAIMFTPFVFVSNGFKLKHLEPDELDIVGEAVNQVTQVADDRPWTSGSAYHPSHDAGLLVLIHLAFFDFKFDILFDDPWFGGGKIAIESDAGDVELKSLRETAKKTDSAAGDAMEHKGMKERAHEKAKRELKAAIKQHRTDRDRAKSDPRPENKQKAKASKAFRQQKATEAQEASKAYTKAKTESDEAELKAAKAQIALRNKQQKGRKYSCKPTAGDFLEFLDGLEFDFMYRRINDKVGVWGGDLAIPTACRTIPFGETGKVVLPSVGLAVFTDGGFRIDLGWPLPSASSWLAASPFVVDWQVGEWPLRLTLGAYFALLHGDDLPKELSEFHQVTRFGVGLTFGLHKDLDFGPLHLSAFAGLKFVVQGFTGSTHGKLPAKFHWYAVQLGIVGRLNGGVDLVIVKASVDLALSIMAEIAWETEYATYVDLMADLKVDLSIHVIFFTIHYRFKCHLRIFHHQFGDGEAAKIKGPSPPKKSSGAAVVSQAVLHAARLAEQYCGPSGTAAGDAESRTLQTDSHDLSPGSVGSTATESSGDAAGDTGNSHVTLRFAVQTTAKIEQGINHPLGVALLLIDTGGKTKVEPAKSEFAKLVNGIATWLYKNHSHTQNTPTGHGNQLPGTQQQHDELVRGLQAVRAWLGSHDFGAQVRTCLHGFHFEIKSASDMGVSDPGSAPPMAYFPMFPEFTLKYKDQDKYGHELRGVPVSPHYLTALNSRNRQLHPWMSAENGREDHDTSIGITELVFTDYFVLLAKQLFEDLVNVVTRHNPKKMLTTLPDALGEVGYASLAGMVSRFMMHGLRLPKSEGSDDRSGLYELTQQQFAIDPDHPGVTLFGDGVIVPRKPVPYGIHQSQLTAVDGTVNPGWKVSSDDAVNAIHHAPQRFIISDSLTWTESKTSAGKTTTTEKVIRRFGPQLLAELQATRRRANAGKAEKLAEWMDLDLQARHDSDQHAANAGANAPVAAVSAMFIPFRLEQVPVPGQPGHYVPGVYRVIGASQNDQELLQHALQAHLADLKSLTLLLSKWTGEYLSASTDRPVLLRTELPLHAQHATLDENGLSTFPYCVDSAKVSDHGGFLRLLWEAGIGQSEGFYLRTDALGTTKKWPASAAVVVEFGEKSGKPRVQNYHNVLVLDKKDDPDAIITTAAGSGHNPVRIWSPSYPAGSVAFQLDWDDVPVTHTVNDAYLNGLYHLLTYRLVSDLGDPASNWSLPTGPTTDHEPSDKLLTSHHFRCTIPVYALQGETNPYKAVGTQVNVQIAAVDVFGNLLPPGEFPKQQLSRPEPALTDTIPLTVVYNDPLLPLNAWPGITTSFTFLPGDVFDPAQLKLTIHYTPPHQKTLTKRESETDTEFAAREVAAAKMFSQTLEEYRSQYAIVANQLDDQHTSAIVTSPLAKPKDIKDVLIKKVGKIRTYLSEVESNPDAKVPKAKIVTADLDADGVQANPSDLVPIRVVVRLARSGVHPDIKTAIPAVASIETEATPFDATNRGNSKSNGNGIQLGNFATSFEAAFKDYAGTGSFLRVAVGPKHSTDDSGAASHRPHQLWAVRWGKHGIAIDFQPDSAFYLAPTPLSTQLLSGDCTYQRQPGDQSTTVRHHFTGVDMDAWARNFLNAVQDLLEPDMAAAIAAHDADLYSHLMKQKGTIAAAISNRIAPVYEEANQALNADAAEKEVTLASAGTRFREALLTHLTNDYSTSAIVQVQAAVTASKKIQQHGHSPKPPRVYGQVAATASPGTTAPYTLSPESLDLTPGRQQRFSILASAQRPAMHADIAVSDLQYHIASLEHDIESSEQACGYVPSSSLTFVLPDARADFTPQIGNVRIPIPLRSFPPDPVLKSQKASAQFAEPATIAQALDWRYEMQVRQPTSQQDDLLITVTFNEPLDAGREWQADAATIYHEGTGTLFQALGRFAAEYPVIQPDLKKIKSSKPGEVNHGLTAVHRFTEHITSVAETWSDWPITGMERYLPPNKKGENGSPDIVSWQYRIIIRTSRTLIVQNISDHSDIPSALRPTFGITGYQLKKSSGRYHLFETDSDDHDALTFYWENLFVVSHQSARGTAQIERNFDLNKKEWPPKPGHAVNSAFVYRTEPVTFKNPIVPMIEPQSPPGLGLGPQSTLADGVGALFRDLEQESTRQHVDVVPFRLVVDYKYELVDGINTQLPVFLIRENLHTDIQSKTHTDTQDKLHTDTQKEVVAGKVEGEHLKLHLHNQLVDWLIAAHADCLPASFYFNLTLFATISTSQLPLAILNNLEAPIRKQYHKSSQEQVQSGAD